MSSSIQASAYVEHFDPELPYHRAWLLAVLERLVSHEPQALEEGGTLRRLWTEHRQSAVSATQSQQPRTPQTLSEASFAVPTSTEAHRGNPLSVPWFSQLDSSTAQARRMCFSSRCAMLLTFLMPGVLTGANGDDQYLQRVLRYGDTTDAAAQLQAVASTASRPSSPKRPASRRSSLRSPRAYPSPGSGGAASLEEERSMGTGLRTGIAVHGEWIGGRPWAQKASEAGGCSGHGPETGGWADLHDGKGHR
jgi:hypothetical protein